VNVAPRRERMNNRNDLRKTKRAWAQLPQMGDARELGSKFRANRIIIDTLLE